MYLVLFLALTIPDVCKADEYDWWPKDSPGTSGIGARAYLEIARATQTALKIDVETD